MMFIIKKITMQCCDKVTQFLRFIFYNRYVVMTFRGCFSDPDLNIADCFAEGAGN